MLRGAAFFAIFLLLGTTVQAAEPRERIRYLALEWLARVQDAETGAWSLTGTEERSKYADGALRENRCQATALALLTLQGAGQTHKRGNYPKQIAKGWKFLLEQQKPDGSIADADGHELFLTHAQCTLALCEMYGMTKDTLFEGAARRAITYAVHSQHRQGGWGAARKPDGTSADSNTAVTCWMMMALRSAQLARLEVPKETFEGVARYLDQAQNREGSRYRASAHPTSPESLALTGQGLFARQLLGCRRDDPGLVAGIDYLLGKLPSYKEPDVTYWYFATQVMHHMEGVHWTKWNTVMREVVVELQNLEEPEQGSWEPRKPRADKLGGERGRLYVTCLSTCTLQVYYRHLPVYAKDHMIAPKTARPEPTPAESAGRFLRSFLPQKHPYEVAEAAVRKLGGEGAFAEKLGVTLHLTKDDEFHGLFSLDLNGSKINDQGLRELGKLPHLHSLDLRRTQVSDAGIRELRGLTSLTSLHLDEIQVTDGTIGELKGLENLENLTLRETRVTGAGLGGFKVLRSLDLSDSQTNDAGLKGFHQLELLKYLHLRGTKVSDGGMAELRGLVRLKELSLSGTKVTDAGLGELAALEKLERLSLDGTQVAGAGFGNLHALEKLTSLSLGETQVNDAGLAKLATLKNLEYLSLNGTPVTDAGLTELKKLPRLESLSLNNTHVTGVGLASLKELQTLTLNDTPRLTEAGLQELGQLGKLEWLYLNKANVTDAGLARLEPLARLEWLDLRGTKITDAGLRHLKPLKALDVLYLAGLPITDASLKDLSPLEKLGILDLSDTPITDEGLKHLKDLKNLYSLDLSKTRVTGAGLRELTELTSIELAGTQFSDENLEELRGLRMYHLDLSRTKVTDAGVKVLKELKTVTSLKLAGTKVTAAGRKELSRVLDPEEK